MLNALVPDRQGISELTLAYFRDIHTFIMHITATLISYLLFIPEFNNGPDVFLFFSVGICFVRCDKVINRSQRALYEEQCLCEFTLLCDSRLYRAFLVA